MAEPIETEEGEVFKIYDKADVALIVAINKEGDVQVISKGGLTELDVLQLLIMAQGQMSDYIKTNYVKSTFH